MIRSARLLTCLAVIGLCGWTVANGWPAVRLALAEARGADAAELRALADDSAIGAEAARELTRTYTDRSPKQREADLTQRLRNAPLSPGAWLDLAIARRAAGEKTVDVATALTLSAMTGPNEAVLMGGRVNFALPFWPALPPDTRRSLIADLVGGFNTLNPEDRDRLAAILQNAPDGAGEQVRAALLTNGDAGAEIATALWPPEAPGKAPSDADGGEQK